MRNLPLAFVFSCMLAWLCLAACERKPEPHNEDIDFVVNGRTGDSELHPSADIQTLRFEVFSKKKWTCSKEGSEVDWLSFDMAESEKKNTWNISFTLTENTGNAPRTAVFLFSSASLTRRVTITQSVEDPIFRTHTIGAYGVPGGDIVFDRERFQYSRLLYGTRSLSFRLYEPSAARVVSLSGLSPQMEAGMRFPVLYRVSEGGYTRVLERFDLQVIRVRTPLVWLKKDENTYFVVKE